MSTTTFEFDANTLEGATSSNLGTGHTYVTHIFTDPNSNVDYFNYGVDVLDGTANFYYYLYASRQTLSAFGTGGQKPPTAHAEIPNIASRTETYGNYNDSDNNVTLEDFWQYTKNPKFYNFWIYAVDDNGNVIETPNNNQGYGIDLT